MKLHEALAVLTGAPFYYELSELRKLYRVWWQLDMVRRLRAEAMLNCVPEQKPAPDQASEMSKAPKGVSNSIEVTMNWAEDVGKELERCRPAVGEHLRIGISHTFATYAEWKGYFYSPSVTMGAWYDVNGYRFELQKSDWTPPSSFNVSVIVLVVHGEEEQPDPDYCVDVPR